MFGETSFAVTFNKIFSFSGGIFLLRFVQILLALSFLLALYSHSLLFKFNRSCKNEKKLARRLEI